MKPVRLPLRLRIVLLVGIVLLCTGAGLFAYRYYKHPVTLSVAVGSIDGEAAKAMSAIASRLVSIDAPARLKIIDTGTSPEAAKAFSEGKVLAAAWKFLGIGKPETIEGPLDSLYTLARRIRKADSEAELEEIEDAIDDILRAQRALAASGDESAVDTSTLNVAAHRLENLIHDRRQVLANRPAGAQTPA